MPRKPAVAQTRERKTVPYTIGQWKGHDNYICGECDFAHLDLGVLEKHVKSAHGGKLADEPAG